jgi:hypothetical protein
MIQVIVGVRIVGFSSESGIMRAPIATASPSVHDVPSYGCPTQ